MTLNDKPTRSLAMCLSALAGYLDAIGFIGTGGYFVSFMSGNSTRLGVGLIENIHLAIIPAGLIVMFLCGAILGSVIGRLAKDKRRTYVLAFVAVTTAIAAILASFGMGWIIFAALAMAMGAENAVFESDGEVRIGLTYMTGTLVKIGQRIAAIFFGGDKLGWLPFFMLWSSLIAGAIAGAATYPYLGLQALWIASGLATVLTFITLKKRL